MTAAILLALAAVQSSDVAPLPAESPIGGPLWSYVVPALLLSVATASTVLLYRRFAKEEE